MTTAERFDNLVSRSLNVWWLIRTAELLDWYENFTNLRRSKCWTLGEEGCEHLSFGL
jgi:hypothetical protein